MMLMTARASYTVRGMTCEHCVSSVSQALTALPEVTDVDIELASGAVVLTHAGRLTDAVVRQAVHDVGYTVAD